jgi:hypothetical protein
MSIGSHRFFSTFRRETGRRESGGSLVTESGARVPSWRRAGPRIRQRARVYSSELPGRYRPIAGSTMPRGATHLSATSVSPPDALNRPESFCWSRASTPRMFPDLRSIARNRLLRFVRRSRRSICSCSTTCTTCGEWERTSWRRYPRAQFDWTHPNRGRARSSRARNGFDRLRCRLRGPREARLLGLDRM